MNKWQPVECFAGCILARGEQKEGKMFIVLILCMLIVPWVIGNGCLRVLYRNIGREKFSLFDALLTGWIAVTGVAEAVHLAAVAGGLSLNRSAFLFGLLTLLLTLGSLAIWLFLHFRKGRDMEKKSPDKPFWLLTVPLVLFLGQAVYVLFAGNVYLSGDMTLETVVSFLHSDGIYQVNPMTGAAYQSGIPLRLKILCLPTLYSMLCTMFSLEPQVVVWQAVPCVTCICCCSAFFCVGKSLFPKSDRHQCCFLTVAAVLLWVGSYSFGMDGFGVLFSGWRGVTVRNAVLIPYLISLCLRRKWRLAVCCIAAEACLVWTFYGAGVCLFVTLGMAFCQFVKNRSERGRHSD